MTYRSTRRTLIVFVFLNYAPAVHGSAPICWVNLASGSYSLLVFLKYYRHRDKTGG